jgi:hypothetical protein
MVTPIKPSPQGTKTPAAPTKAEALAALELGAEGSPVCTMEACHTSLCEVYNFLSVLISGGSPLSMKIS